MSGTFEEPLDSDDGFVAAPPFAIEELVAYRDGCLSPADEARVESILARSAEARAQLRTIRVSQESPASASPILLNSVLRRRWLRFAAPVAAIPAAVVFALGLALRTPAMVVGADHPPGYEIQVVSGAIIPHLGSDEPQKGALVLNGAAATIGIHLHSELYRKRPEAVHVYSCAAAGRLERRPAEVVVRPGGNISLETSGPDLLPGKANGEEWVVAITLDDAAQEVVEGLPCDSARLLRGSAVVLLQADVQRASQ